ncbi:hypothetical protein EF912_21785 [Streptomyces sp. WAC07061]|uniref:hypothetical protein n=1 Tax=Streptomyces sp. WAC07061 TaxID=2487410 RepID=UPI000F7A3A1C|nr:hypothetical protein [Streptomyces sp. WAC07061]RSS50400.1 hypothetical protein EF912_21785 [Streptomyces sp. WAC07061]
MPAVPDGTAPRAEEAHEDREDAAAAAARRHLEELWGGDVADWQEWLARSPEGVDLLLWWQRRRELPALVGPDRYRERLAVLLSRAAPRDIAALGLGCSRRVDRRCRTPEVCGQDPAPPRPGSPAPHRSGPVPGACSRFTDCYSAHEVRVHFTGDDRHRAVLLLRGGPDAARMWVDGVPVGEGRRLDNGGWWQDDRFYVIRVGGPDGHPLQGLGDIGDWLCRIVSLLVYDAERAVEHVFVPGPDEEWTDPVLEIRDGTGHLYATQEAREAGTADRAFPLNAPSPG